MNRGRLRRNWIRILWTLVVLLLLLVFLGTYMGQVYRVDSGSMRPTIFGGRAQPDGERYDEWVLVRFSSDMHPERFDLAVVRTRAEGELMVKRVVGLPNEKVFIYEGDLFVDGKHLPPDAPRPAPIVVFDDRHQSIEDYFQYKRATAREKSPWTLEADGLDLDARDVVRGSQQGLMLYHPDLRDSHLDRRGVRHPGLRQVNDGAIECEFQVREVFEEGALRFRLVEEGDSFEVEISELEEPGEPAQLGLLRILRWNPETLSREQGQSRRDVLGELPVNVPRNTWVSLFFSNFDNTLRIESEELGVRFTHTYEMNVPYPGRKPAGDKSIGHRVAFGGERIRARFRNVRVLRDLFYTSVGEHATQRPLQLGPSQCFVLGDHSAFSTDSRTFGAVDLAQLVAEPVGIVWPKPRLLDPVREPVR